MGGVQAKAYMGWWGHIGSPKQKYVTTYTISPYAGSPLKGSLHNFFFNTFRRTKNQAFFILVPAFAVYAIWNKAEQYNAYLYTKAGREELERVNV